MSVLTFIFTTLFIRRKGRLACVLCAQLCPTLDDPMNCSPSGSSVHGISQARILVWVAISFFRGSSQPGIEPTSPASNTLTVGFFTTVSPGNPNWSLECLNNCPRMVLVSGRSLTGTWAVEFQSLQSWTFQKIAKDSNSFFIIWRDTMGERLGLFYETALSACM